MKMLLRMGIGLPGLVAGAALFAAEVQFGNQILKVPDGFTVERVTTTNLVKRPVTASFDEQGGLYVTDSSGSSSRAQRGSLPL